MNTRFHLQPARDVMPIHLDHRTVFAAPFALAVLPGIRGAELLDRHRGELLDLEPLADVLQQDACLASDVQSLYLFPRLVDVGALGRMLAPGALAVVTEAMCADWLHRRGGRASALAPLVPVAALGSIPLAFVVGVVIVEPLDGPPMTTRKKWWIRSAARQGSEALIAAQLGEVGGLLSDPCLPTAPTSLAEALSDGLAGLSHSVLDRCLSVRR